MAGKMEWNTLCYRVKVNSYAGFYHGDIIPVESVVDVFGTKENCISRVKMGAVEPVDPKSLPAESEHIHNGEQGQPTSGADTVDGTGKSTLNTPGERIYTDEELANMSADDIHALGVTIGQKQGAPVG